MIDRIMLGASTTNGANAGQNRFVHLDLGSYNYQFGYYFYRMNQRTKFIVGPSRYPNIRFMVNTQGDILAECVIAGEFIQG